MFVSECKEIINGHFHNIYLQNLLDLTPPGKTDIYQSPVNDRKL